MLGWLVDTYTFIFRGGMFAAGQTGNIIFLAGNLANGDFQNSLLKAVTIICFWLGTIFSAIWTKMMDKTHYWRVLSLFPEMVILFIQGFMPQSVSNYLIVPPLAIAMALQNSLYDHVDGFGYANVFATANLKKATLSLTTAILYRQHHSLRFAKIYFSVIVCFVFGAITGAILINLIGSHAIWIAAAAVLTAIIYHILLIHRKEQTYTW